MARKSEEYDPEARIAELETALKAAQDGAALLSEANAKAEAEIATLKAKLDAYEPAPVIVEYPKWLRYPGQEPMIVQDAAHEARMVALWEKA